MKESFITVIIRVNLLSGNTFRVKNDCQFLFHNTLCVLSIRFSEKVYMGSMNVRHIVSLQ